MSDKRSQIKEAFHYTFDDYWRKLRSHHFWSRFQLGITLGILVIMLVTPYMGHIGSISGASDYYTYLAATLIAFLGVSVSGYIFLIESIRKLTENNPIYANPAEQMRENILKNIIVSLIVGIIYSVGCGILAVAEDYNGHLHGIGIAILIYGTLIIYSLRLDFRMMSFKNTMEDIARKNADELLETLRNEPVIIYVNPTELDELERSGDITPGVVMKRSSVKKALYFVRGSNHQELVNRFKRKVESDTKKETIECPLLYQEISEAVMCDPYIAQSWGVTDSIRLPRGRFDIFLARLPKDMIKDKKDPRSVKILLKNHDARSLTIALDEDVNDISMDDRLIIGHKDLSDEFDLNNVLKIFDDSEKLIFRIVNEKEGILDEGDMQRLATVLGVSTYGDYGMADEIIESYVRLKRYHDCIIVGNQPRKNNEYKIAMMGHVYALRYQLTKKLSDLDLSGMNLTSFDFSYGRMENTLLRNGILTNACFFKTRMNGSNLEDCDIGGTMFKDCEMDKCSLNRSKLTSATFDNVLMESTSFVEAEISSIHIRDIRMRDAAFTKSNMRSTSFTEVILDHSNFQESTLTDVTFGRCHMANSIFIGCTSSESTFDDSVLRGGNFRGAMMDNTTMTRSNLGESEFSDANVTSAMICRSIFSNTICENVNFTGSILLACKFDTSLLSRSAFVKAYIGSWELRPAERNWVARDQAIIEHEKNLSSGVRAVSHSIKSRKEENGTFAYSTATRERYENVIGDSADLVGMEGRISLFDHSTMEDCLFTETEIADSMMRFVILSGSRFNNSRITNSSFEGSILNNISVSKCTLVNVNFDHTSWNGSTLSDVRSDSCDFCNCSITGASLVSVMFDRCNLENTAFRGSKVIGCSFTDMIITEELLRVADACEFTDCTFRGMGKGAMKKDNTCRFTRCTFIDCENTDAIRERSVDCTFHGSGATDDGTA